MSDPVTPLQIQDRADVLKQNATEDIEWRYGEVPSYDSVTPHREREKKHNHAEGTLDLIAHNLVRTFEMEATFKTNPNQWISVVTDKFRMSTNGGKEYTTQDVVNEGTYNLFLEDSEHYQSSKEDFESSYELFHNAFPEGFHWELIEVVAGPPSVVFKWRHWGNFKGAYKDNQPTNESIEIVGLSIAKVTDDLKIESVEHFFDTAQFMNKLGGTSHPHA